MTSKKISVLTDTQQVSTGRWYSFGKINVSVETARKVPWKSGTKTVEYYDEKNNELRIKPLAY